MKRRLMIILALSGSFTLPTFPAIAGKSDDSWAKCVWERVPTSAAHWLAMPVFKHEPGPTEPGPGYVLQFRLQAACYDALTPAGKKRPPSFNAAKVHEALAASRPATVGPDTAVVAAYRCDHFFENDTEMKNIAGSDWGYGDPKDAKYFFTVRYFFAASHGGPVGLAEGAGLNRCRVIQDDGTFANA